MTVNTTPTLSLHDERRESARRLVDFLNSKAVKDEQSRGETIAAIRTLKKKKLEESEAEDLLALLESRLCFAWILNTGGVSALQCAGYFKTPMREYTDEMETPLEYFHFPKGPESFGLELLVTASIGGSFDYVGQCGRCGKWFVGKHRNPRYCSSDCYEGFWTDFQQSDEGKALNRKYVAEHRARRKK